MSRSSSRSATSASTSSAGKGRSRAIPVARNSSSAPSFAGDLAQQLERRHALPRLEPRDVGGRAPRERELALAQARCEPRLLQPRALLRPRRRRASGSGSVSSSGQRRPLSPGRLKERKEVSMRIRLLMLGNVQSLPRSPALGLSGRRLKRSVVRGRLDHRPSPHAGPLPTSGNARLRSSRILEQRECVAGVAGGPAPGCPARAELARVLPEDAGALRRDR